MKQDGSPPPATSPTSVVVAFDLTGALELKVWRGGRPDPLPEGLEQLSAYLDRLGLAEGDPYSLRHPHAGSSPLRTVLTE